MKLKTNKSLAKRVFRKKNKIMFAQTCRRHGNIKKNKKFMRTTRKTREMHKSDAKRLRHHLSLIK